jgi:HK97 family phage major capsid protein
MSEINEKLNEIKEGLETSFNAQNEAKNAEIAELRSQLETLAAKFNTPEFKANEKEEVIAEERTAFFKAMKTRNFNEWSNMVQERALAGGSTTGGYLVLPDFQKEIITGVSQVNPFRKNGDVNKTGSDKVIFGTLSDFSAAWGDGAPTPITETGAHVSADVKSLKVLVKLPLITLEDSEADLESEFSKLSVKAFAKAEREAMTETVSDAVEALVPALTTASKDIDSGVDGSLGADDAAIVSYLNSMVYALHEDYADNGKWMMNRKTLGVLASVYHSNGAPIYDASSNKLLGFEVLSNANMDDISVAASTTNPIIFGDFSNYAIRDRKALTVTVLEERYRDEGKIGYLYESRIAAKCKDTDAFRVSSVTTA